MIMANFDLFTSTMQLLGLIKYHQAGLLMRLLVPRSRRDRDYSKLPEMRPRRDVR